MRAKPFFFAILLASLIMVGQAQSQYGLDFDGTDDYVVVPDNSSLDIQDEITIEFWFYLEGISSVNTLPRVVSKGQSTNTNGAYGVLVRDMSNPKQITFRFISSTGTTHNIGSSNLTLYDNGWHHVAATYSNSTDRGRLFLDGTQVRNLSITGDVLIASTNDNLQIGNGRSNRPFNGKVDEVRIWKTALTVTQIRDNMHRELVNPSSLTDLVAYYRFNEGSGQSVADASSSGNNGTLGSTAGTDINDPVWVASTAPIPYYTVQNGYWNSNASWASGQRAPVNAWSRVKISHQISLLSYQTVKDLTISPSSLLTIMPTFSLTVTGAFVNSSGYNGLVLKADATGMASLLHNSSTIAGTVQQYVTADQWHYISSPITSGVAGTYMNIYMKRWDEPDSTWNYITATTYPLPVTKGFAVWASGSLTGSTTVTYKGTLNNGNKTATLTFNDGPGQGHGWNLIGNPFPSSVVWNTSWTSNNVDATIYVWDGIQYLTWNRNTLLGTKADGTIPVTQGFFVKASGSGPTLTIPQDARINGSQSFYKSGEPPSAELRPVVRLKAWGNGYHDQTIICFNPEATEFFDSEYDAYKIPGLPEAPQFYSILGTINLTVNTLPDESAKIPVLLGFSAGAPGKYTISAVDLPGIIPAYLEDLKTGELIDLNAISEYSFIYTEEDDPARFIIYFYDPEKADGKLAVPGAVPVLIYSLNQNIVFDPVADIQGVAEVYDLTGRKVASVILQGEKKEITLMNGGFYIISVKDKNGPVYTRKVCIP